MPFEPPFFDGTRAAVAAALERTLRARATEIGAHVQRVDPHLGICRVWSRGEHPVAIVGLGYDMVRIRFQDDYQDVPLRTEPLDAALVRAAVIVTERASRIGALGPRAPGDVGGDEPSRLNAEMSAVDPELWAGSLLDRLLSGSRFGPGRIALSPALSAIERWLSRATPRVPPGTEEIGFNLYHWPGDDSTACAEPPESLPAGEWIGIEFERRLKRNTEEGTLSSGHHGLTFWFTPDDEWRALLATLELQPVSVVSLESYGQPGSWAPWLLEADHVRRILATAQRRPPALAVVWSTDEEREFRA